MPNEMNTLNIVRAHFQQFGNLVKIEEQFSEDTTIRKLLKNASKSGFGEGKPDFLLRVKQSVDLNSESIPNELRHILVNTEKLLIVIECKAERSKHQQNQNNQTNEKDNAKLYAVEGVLHYASFLSRQWDVLAIAVSGDDPNFLKVSHFLQFQNQEKATPIFLEYGDLLLSLETYLSGYKRNPQKYREDLEALQTYKKILNKKLHSYRIPENKRALLVSGILIALRDRVFSQDYKLIKEPKTLARRLVETLANIFDSMPEYPRKVVLADYGFIKNENTLSREPGVLENLIREMDTNVFQFVETHEFEDILGEMYVEFLRYANTDKGLGIVLTPPHITKWFCDLAQVNVNSIVYDNCAGTGGFLLSAMQKMAEGAKGDTRKISQIKTEQIVGVEVQAQIYTLLVSNLRIHGDGSASLLYGDCFQPHVVNSVKQKKPTVGFLNPPYKANKQQDKDELEFVENNLQVLSENGTCIALVPMQSALAVSGRVRDLKAKLLKNHTLKAVLSLPDDLFSDSKVSVVSCAMIFQAHKPHSSNQETFFGYFKDDGHVKKKQRGRVDENKVWPEIKQKWTHAFLNNKIYPGLTVTKHVTADDEWCAEAYLDTDYGKLTPKHFTETCLKYATFLYANGLRASVSKTPYTLIGQNSSLSDQRCLPVDFETTEWKMYTLETLFTLKSSTPTTLVQIKKAKPGKYPHVTAQATNNGVSGFYEADSRTTKGNILTVESVAMGYCTYQPLDFSGTSHVEQLKPQFELNPYIALFFVTLLNQESYRYNYGRGCTHGRLRNLHFLLPSRSLTPEGKHLKDVTGNYEPDFEFIETFMKSLPHSSSLEVDGLLPSQTHFEA